jgi:hypothetical protein
MQAWWSGELLYVLTNMAIKASIAIFLLRVVDRRVHKIIIWAATIVTEVYSAFFFFLFVLQCRPSALVWLRYTANPPEGSCIDPNIVAYSFYGYSAISCVADWTLAVLPIFVVWNLQMNLRTKMSVVLILAAGIMYVLVLFPFLTGLRYTWNNHRF